jgi:ADP-ribose pyrophosphatase
MKILRTKRLTNERWVNLFERFFRHNGREGRWVFASRRQKPAVPAKGFDAVVIVPILRDRGQTPRLVLLKEFRIALGAYEYSFPAGLVERGETVEEAARRELQEETGLELVKVTRISPPTYSSAGMTDESVVILFATARTPTGCKQSLDETEDIEVLLLDHRQVCDLCRSSKRINSRTWPILYMIERLGPGHML